jgi:hypothetical protein
VKPTLTPRASAGRERPSFRRAITDRAFLDRFLLSSAVVLTVGALGAAVVADDWRARSFFALYIAPLFLVAPLWVRLRVAGPRPARGTRAWVDVVVFVLSCLRYLFTGLFPFSGHMLFLTYSALTTREAWYRWVAAALLVETTVFKLWVWRDATTWSLGLALGLLAAVAYWWVGNDRSFRRRAS